MNLILMNNTFIEHCVSGNLNGIKCLSLKDCDLDKGFREACYYGHYDVVKYLVELYKTKNPKDINVNNYKMINIHLKDEAGFIWACINGHYMIVKYLVELHENDINYKMINIHCYDGVGFWKACYNGHYDVVKYLVELYKKNKHAKINIHSYNNSESDFKWVCKNGYNKTIKYLMTLYKKHKYIYKPIINYLHIFNKFNKFMFH